MTARLLVGDVFDRLAELPDASVDLVVTSPPFLALRSYLDDDHPDKGREIGGERTPADFLDSLLRLSAELRRVLAPHGSLCVELGDTFSGSGGAGSDYKAGGMRAGQPTWEAPSRRMRPAKASPDTGGPEFERSNKGAGSVAVAGGLGWPPAKSLTGVPTLYPWSLAYGRNLLTGEESPAGRWRIRNVLVWARPNPAPGKTFDKFRPATSYITVACTSAKRWFDLVAVSVANPRAAEEWKANANRGHPDFHTDGARVVQAAAGAPPRDWVNDFEDGPTGDRLWCMSTSGYEGAHYATFPLELPQRLIKAMCPLRVCTTCGVPSARLTNTTYVSLGDPARDNAQAKAHTVGGNGYEGRVQGMIHGRATKHTETVGWSDCGHGTWRAGLVLDPFAGTGTTLAAAIGLGRDAIGIDFDEANALLAQQRCGMFVTIDTGPCDP